MKSGILRVAHQKSCDGGAAEVVEPEPSEILVPRFEWREPSFKRYSEGYDRAIQYEICDGEGQKRHHNCAELESAPSSRRYSGRYSGRWKNILEDDQRVKAERGNA